VQARAAASGDRQPHAFRRAIAPRSAGG
jgi:hypothetical protein